MNQSAADPSRWPEFAVRYLGAATGGDYSVDFKMVKGPEQLHVTIGVAVLEPQEGVTASITGGERRRMVRDLSREIIVFTNPPVSDMGADIEVIATCEDVDPPHERWSLHRALKIPRPARIHRAQGRIPRTS